MYFSIRYVYWQDIHVCGIALANLNYFICALIVFVKHRTVLAKIMHAEGL